MVDADECWCHNVGATDVPGHNRIMRWAICCDEDLTTLSPNFHDLFYGWPTCHIPYGDYAALTAPQQEEIDNLGNVIVDGAPTDTCSSNDDCASYCIGTDFHDVECVKTDGIFQCTEIAIGENAHVCRPGSDPETSLETPDGISEPSAAVGVLGLIALAYLLLRRKHK